MTIRTLHLQCLDQGQGFGYHLNLFLQLLQFLSLILNKILLQIQLEEPCVIGVYYAKYIKHTAQSHTVFCEFQQHELKLFCLLSKFPAVFCQQDGQGLS